MNQDKLQCILAVTSTLRQLIQSLRKYPDVLNKGIDFDGPIPVGELNGQVSFTECGEFIDLVASLVTDAEGNFDELQGLLLNTDPTLIPTLVSIITIAPTIFNSGKSHESAEGTGKDTEEGGNDAVHPRSDDHSASPFAKFVISSLQCILQIVNVGCVDVYESPTRSRDGGHSQSDPNSVSIEGKRLSEMLGAMFKRSELAHSLVALVDEFSIHFSSPSPLRSSPIVRLLRFGASKLLFTATLRVPAVKASVANNEELLSALFDAALSEENNKIRTYFVGTLREIAGSHPLQMTHSGGDNIRCFARLFATDTHSDVRTMSAEAVDVIYRNEPQRWADCECKSDLSTAIISRLEDSEETPETLVAVLRLLETLLIADAALSMGNPSTASSHKIDTSSSSSSFTKIFSQSGGERSLVLVMRGTSEADSLAARCLRLLIEFAPCECEVALNITQHFPTLSVVLKAIVALASDKSDDENVADMRFELSLALGLLLCQDPRARTVLANELKPNPVWMSRLRGAMLSSLNQSTLSDFSGIRIIDAIGDNLSDVGNVRWEEELKRPVRESLEEFMNDQMRRFDAYHHQYNTEEKAKKKRRVKMFREVPKPDPNGDSLETRLTFVLLTNTIHNTFNPNSNQTINKAERSVDGVAAQYRVGGLLADLGVNATASQGKNNAPRNEVSEFQNLLLDEESPLEKDQQRLPSEHRDSKIINELSRIDKTILRKSVAAASQSSYYPTTAPLPGQTRTSLIREWKNNPKKLEAIKKMAREVYRDPSVPVDSFNNHANGFSSISQQENPTMMEASHLRPANFLARSTSTNHGRRGSEKDILVPLAVQYRRNFVSSDEKSDRSQHQPSVVYVDPFSEPTSDSFKKPLRNPTVGSLVAAARSTLSSHTRGYSRAADNNDDNNKSSLTKRFTKFDASLRLCEVAGQHYMPISDLIETAVATASDRKTLIFETSGDGFAQRRSNRSSASISGIGGGSTSSSSKQRMPKTWSINDLREGDLFYFAIPFATLSAFAVDQVRIQAVRHLNHLKRSYLVVPNNMKGRRWFIFDMSTYVMPHVVAALDDILELIETHGEENCRFPLLMFKEGEINQISGSLHGKNDVPEGTLNSGNLFESLDQLKFYFSKMSAINPVAAAASSKVPSYAQGPAEVGHDSQYLVDLENKINALKQRTFEPRTDAKFMHAFGGEGPAAIIPTDYARAAGDEDDELFDEIDTAPPPTSGLFSNSQNDGITLSAARARAMLSHNLDDGEEIETVEPSGY